MRRRKKLAVLKRAIPARITDEELGRLLRVHSSHQPWHAHLDEAVEATIQAVRDYQRSPARGLVASG